ncbi:MAG: type I secretion C-terminal target domain-containing protein [Betaproteobacteria bacterium]|nr:MAG: type I secretion C-terminal target domain-containing protein [Betaproteobacteria bacterium]
MSLDTEVLRLIATATDADGDRHSAAIDLGDRVSFYDDGPEIVLPAAASVSNMAAATATAALDFDFSIGDNTGADQPGAVAFSAAQDGKDSGLTSAGQPIYLYVSDDGQTLTGSTATAEGDVAATNSVFTLAINQGGAGNDTYTVTMLGTVDNGSGIEFNDLSGTGPAGNPPWKVVESGVAGRDLLFTPAGEATSVNSDADDVGVDSQFIDWAKGLRIDFADFNVTGKHAGLDYSFGPEGHYTVNHVSFAINQISNGAVADVTVKAFDADEDDPVQSTLGDDAQQAITQVQVYDGAQNLVAVATDDGTVGGIDFDFNSDAAGGVTIRGLGEGQSVVTTTAEGYDRIEIFNAGAEDGDGKFSISDLDVLTVDTGEPVSTGFDVTLTDADGDSTAGLISVTFEPVGLGGADNPAGDTAPFAAGDDDAASAAAGGDVLVSGPAPSSFGDTEGDQGDAGTFGTDESAPAVGGEPVDLNAMLDGALPKTSSAAELEGYVTLDTETSPGSTIVMVDPNGGGDYQPLLTLNDVTNLTLQELLDNQHLVVN